MVAAGAAAPYFYGYDKGKYAVRLMGEALKAKRSTRGLWGACPGTTLDRYRAVDTGTSCPPTRNPYRTASAIRTTRGACVPPYPADLDCADLRALGLAPVRSIGSDPNGFDGDDDGIG